MDYYILRIMLTIAITLIVIVAYDHFRESKRDYKDLKRTLEAIELRNELIKIIPFEDRKKIPQISYLIETKEPLNIEYWKNKIQNRKQ